MDIFPDPVERKNFSDKVLTEVQKSSYHLYATMFSFKFFTFTESRYIVIGRKPNAGIRPGVT